MTGRDALVCAQLQLIVMLSVRPRRAFAARLFGLIVLAHPAFAQTGAKSADSTRAQLAAQARVADSLGRKDEAFQLRARLQNGDFEVGDRVFFSFETPPVQPPVQQQKPFSDTLVVLAGKILRLPEPLQDLNVGGLLVFELGDSIVARVNRYFKNATVRVNPLLRIEVSGAVLRGGFYYLPTDVPLGDLFMRSGGQHPLADLQNVVIRRGTSVLWTATDVQSALADGLTLQQLDLQPGDHVVVGTKTGKPWVLIMQVGLPIVAILIPLLLRR